MLIMKKLLLLIALICPLYGCVPTVLVAAGAAAGASVAEDNRSIKTMLQDRHAAQTAQNMINDDKPLDARSHISVVVYNHVGLLVGQAQTPELRERAYKLVEKVPNINRIYNEIAVAGPTSMLQRTNDTWLTTKVRTAMLTAKGLRSNDIKVVTEDNVVYLMGLTDQAQAKKATEVARRVKGVTKVVKVFQYSQA